MYSMKRSTMPLWRKCRAIGTISCSLVPRLTTMLTLIGARPDGLGLLDAAQHVGHREVDVVHASEDGVVERIQADRHALQPGVLQRACLASPAASRWSSA